MSVRKSKSASGTLAGHAQSRDSASSEHAQRRYTTEKLSWICCTRRLPQSSTGSSCYQTGPAAAWFVSFYDGTDSVNINASNYDVRAVRGGL